MTGSCDISRTKGSKYDTGRVVRIRVSVSTVLGRLFKHHSWMTFGFNNIKGIILRTQLFFIAEIRFQKTTSEYLQIEIGFHTIYLF